MPPPTAELPQREHGGLPKSSSPTPGRKSSEAHDSPVITADGKQFGSDNSAAESDSPGGEAGFKEGGYGWVVCISVLLINAHTWGLNSSYAVFLAYYLRTDLIAGSSALGFAFIGGLSVSIALLVSPIVTLSIGYFGTKTTLRIGTVLQAVSFIGASFATHIYHLILSQGICFGLGLGFCFTATVGLIPQWFNKRRSFANALAAGGSGLGGLTYSLATNTMISTLGLDWAFRILAIVSFVVNGACSLTVKDRNKAVGAIHIPIHLPLFKRLEYWLFIGWGFFGLISYIIVVFSITDYAQVVGLTASQGSIAAAVFNLSQGIGRPVIGLISDRFGRLNIAAMGSLAACVAVFFPWIFAGKYYVGLIIYALLGVFAGIIWPCVAPVGAEVVGLQLLPSALSLYWLTLVLPATFAMAIGLSLRDPGVNGYIRVQILTGVFFFASFLSVWFLRSWKIQEMDALDLSEEQQEAGIQDDDVISNIASATGRQSEHRPSPGLFRAYIYGMLAIRRV
ncbi:Major facilitator superfamily domain containing protein [Naviculisporaceae sp. PSN 640]